MKIEARRQLYAWLLLSVFVPMMAIASLHIHPNYNEEASTICLSCIHHQAHAGHLIKATGHLHDCVLCQLLTYSFLVSTPLLLHLFIPYYNRYFPFDIWGITSSYCGTLGSRAPPSE